MTGTKSVDSSIQIIYFAIPEKDKDKLTEEDLEAKVAELEIKYPEKSLGWFPLKQKHDIHYIRFQTLFDMLEYCQAADILYLWDGWADDFNCRILYEVAKENNIPILYDNE